MKRSMFVRGSALALALVGWCAISACGSSGGGGGNDGGGGGGNDGGGGGGGNDGGLPCGGPCRAGFVCQANACVVDPTGLWVLTVVSGRINERKTDGNAWDTLGGLPDPFVCLTINGDRRCTSTADDTLQPQWNESYPAATATALQAGVRAEMWDEDISNHDSICGAGLVTVATSTFQTGSLSAGCTSGTFAATLRPR